MNDLISRQAVQDYIAKYLSQYLYNDVREAVEVIDEYIGELPPVKQEPVLDKIRAEIKQLPYQRIFGNVSSYSLLDVVVEIIDKYRAESEKE